MHFKVELFRCFEYVVASFPLCTDGAVCKKKNAAHQSLPFMSPFLSSVKLQGIAEEDTCTCPLHTEILIYCVSVEVPFLLLGTLLL